MLTLYKRDLDRLAGLLRDLEDAFGNNFVTLDGVLTVKLIGEDGAVQYAFIRQDEEGGKCFIDPNYVEDPQAKTQDVTVMAEEYVEATEYKELINHALAKLGISYTDLMGMASEGDFPTPEHKKLWISIAGQG